MFRRREAESIPHQELIQIDTTNILFICGGAFDGLEKIMERKYWTERQSALIQRFPRKLQRKWTICFMR